MHSCGTCDPEYSSQHLDPSEEAAYNNVSLLVTNCAVRRQLLQIYGDATLCCRHDRNYSKVKTNYLWPINKERDKKSKNNTGIHI